MWFALVDSSHVRVIPEVDQSYSGHYTVVWEKFAIKKFSSVAWWDEN